MSGRLWCIGSCDCHSTADRPASSSAGAVPAGRGDTELREQIARTLEDHFTEADNDRGCALRCGYADDDRADHLAAALLVGPLQGLLRDHQAGDEQIREHARYTAELAWNDGYDAARAGMQRRNPFRRPVDGGEQP